MLVQLFVLTNVMYYFAEAHRELAGSAVLHAFSTLSTVHIKTLSTRVPFVTKALASHKNRIAHLLEL